MEVTLIPALLRMRSDFQAGRIEMHLGETTVERFVGYVAGYLECMLLNGRSDTLYLRFREWMIARGEFPSEGWAAKFLREEGDDVAAIRRFLDLVAQYEQERNEI